MPFCFEDKDRQDYLGYRQTNKHSYSATIMQICKDENYTGYYNKQIFNDICGMLLDFFLQNQLFEIY